MPEAVLLRQQHVSWELPAELKGLSQTEEMLIARCCPIMRVIHLKGGQLGYGGHVVNVAQDITTFAATLPRLAADVPIIILRREGQEPGQHKDLHVRRVRVQRALIWLIANNPCLLYTSPSPRD